MQLVRSRNSASRFSSTHFSEGIRFNDAETLKKRNRVCRAIGNVCTCNPDYSDVVTITLTVTLSPRRLPCSLDVVKERANRAEEMIVVERGGHLKYALSLPRYMYINNPTSAHRD